MLRFLTLLLVTSALWAQERLYIVQSDETLAEVRLDDGATNMHVLDLGYGCNDVAVSGNRLYVTNSLLNTVQEIDAETNQTLRDIPTTGGANPYSVVALNTDTLAVTCWVTDNLLLIRLSDGTVIGNIPVGTKPQGVLVDGDRLFVCLTRFLSFGEYGPGAVMVYNRHTLAFEDSVSAGTNPQFAAVDDRGRLHVVCTGDYNSIAGEVDIVNPATLDVDTVLAIGGTPWVVSFSGGHAVVSAGGWGGAGLVYRYGLDDLAIVRGADNPIETGIGASDVEARPDGTFYVTCYQAAVLEHRDSDGNLLESFSLSTGPGQMVLYPGASGMETPPEVIPRDLRIAAAYPNPFNSTVTLRLARAYQSESCIIIYNDLGQKVETIDVPAGARQIPWMAGTSSLNDISTGSYWAVWEVGGAGPPLRLVYVK